MFNVAVSTREMIYMTTLEEANNDALANSICHAGRLPSGIHDFNRL